MVHMVTQCGTLWKLRWSYSGPCAAMSAGDSGAPATGTDVSPLRPAADLLPAEGARTGEAAVGRFALLRPERETGGLARLSAGALGRSSGAMEHSAAAMASVAAALAARVLRRSSTAGVDSATAAARDTAAAVARGEAVALVSAGSGGRARASRICWSTSWIVTFGGAWDEQSCQRRSTKGC